VPQAGVPSSDLRGQITSHRARSTIATQIYNAKEPMSLLALKEWLGHRRLASTQWYAAITPDRLAQAYVDARYFERNVVVIQVLLDRAAIESGASGRAKHTNMSTLGMATVRILTGRSASIEWLASAVTSTYLVIRQGLRLLKQVLTISASWHRSP
jgi:hypothetical protein